MWGMFTAPALSQPEFEGKCRCVCQCFHQATHDQPIPNGLRPLCDECYEEWNAETWWS